MSTGGRGFDEESTVGTLRPSPTRADRIADHTHERHLRRLAIALADTLPQLLAHNEQVLAFTEAVERTSALTRAVLGAGWVPFHRVALVLTARRLIEVGLNSTGRRVLGPMRSFPWDRVPGFEIRGRWLELRTWSEAGFAWHLRDELDEATRDLLHTQVDLAVSTYQPAEMRSVPLDHCCHCGAVRITAGAPCTSCELGVHSPRLAGRLALAIPGGGLLYTRRPLAAVLRAGFELLIWALLAGGLLTAGQPRTAAIIVVAGAALLGMMKVQGRAAARILAPRAGVIRSLAEGRWKWFGAASGLLSVAALIIPLTMVGSADRELSWDLDFANSDGSWNGLRVRSAWSGDSDDPEFRSEWIHGDGRVVQIRARPLPRFESIAAARARLADAAEPGDGDLRVGPHRAAKLAELLPAATAGQERLRFTLQVVDEMGRDLHELSTETSPADAARAEELVMTLLSRGYWVRPSPPE